MFMNRYDIEAAANAKHDCPNVRKGVRLLLKFMEAADAQSDGWAYWPAPSRAASKLMELLEKAGTHDGIAIRPFYYGTHGKISDADLKKAIAPIRAMVTRQKKHAKLWGHCFLFDVDAALTPNVVEDDETGRFVCKDCGYEYSAMLGDNEVPEYHC